MEFLSNIGVYLFWLVAGIIYLSIGFRLAELSRSVVEYWEKSHTVSDGSLFFLFMTSSPIRMIFYPGSCVALVERNRGVDGAYNKAAFKNRTSRLYYILHMFFWPVRLGWHSVIILFGFFGVSILTLLVTIIIQLIKSIILFPKKFFS